MFEIYVDIVKNHYFDFAGRLSRKAYWEFFAVNFIISIVFRVLTEFVPVALYLAGIYSALIFLPSLGAAVRRLHDANFRGWLVVTGLLGIPLIILLLVPGTNGENRFGREPADHEAAPASLKQEARVTADNTEDDAETVMVAVEDDDDLTEAVEYTADSEPEPEAYLIRLPDYVRIDMRGWSYTIGKNAAKADYVVSSEKTVSRSHATISAAKDSYFITDNGSKNGTFVNDVKTIPDVDYPLHDGDIIRLSNVEFIFHTA